MEGKSRHGAPSGISMGDPWPMNMGGIIGWSCCGDSYACHGDAKNHCYSNYLKGPSPVRLNGSWIVDAGCGPKFAEIEDPAQTKVEAEFRLGLGKTGPCPHGGKGEKAVPQGCHIKGCQSDPND